MRKNSPSRSPFSTSDKVEITYEKPLSKVVDGVELAHNLRVLAVELEKISEKVSSSNSKKYWPDSYEAAKSIYKFRRTREKFIDGVFGEPAWDILLELFMRRCQNEYVTVKSVQISSNAAATTSLRWIRTLIDKGLLEKKRDELDSRVRLIRLSDLGFRAMKLILAEYSPNTGELARRPSDRTDSGQGGG